MNKKVWQYISEKSGEEILEWRVCRWTGEDFPVFKKEAEILKKISPSFFGKTYNIPLPKLSPKARMIKKMLWRNERFFYKRKCDFSGKEIFSLYPKEFQGKVFNFNDFISDNWDIKNYNTKLDLTLGIKEQIQDFINKVPQMSQNIRASHMENCNYCNFGLHSKDCYMCQTPVMSEKCFNSYTPIYCTNVLDGHLMNKSENCYESIGGLNCYNVFYSQALESCRDCYFGYYLKNCKNCIGCVDLDGKEYYILNKKVTKEEYENKLKNILSSYRNVEKFKEEFDIFKKTFLLKNINIIKSENCFGNGFQSSKNGINCFDILDVDTAFHTIHSGINTSYLLNSYSTGGNDGTSYLNESIGGGAGYKSSFLIYSNVENSYYVREITNGKNLFLCSSLKNKEYCIFNKQYTKEEYEKIVPKIIEKMKEEKFWGDFFETGLSPFPYNDTIANDNYPIKKIVYLDENKKFLKQSINDKNGEGIVYVLENDKFISDAILDLGGEEKIKIKWRTKENEVNINENTESINAGNLGEVQDIGNDILNKVIICKKSGRPFRIIKQELEFYKKYNLPIPRLHPDIRFKNRLNKRAKFDLSLKNCNKCRKEVLSAWGENDVICEDCYDKEVY